MNRMTLYLNVFMVMAILIGTSRCSYNHVASPIPFDSNVLVPLSTCPGINLINDQPRTDKVMIGSAGAGRDVYANFHQWTEAAIKVLGKEFQQRNIVVSNSSSKILRIAVTKAELSLTGGGWGFKCMVWVQVTTGDNQTFEFNGERGSYKYTKVSNAGITEALSNMLRDSRIQAYLMR